MSASAAPRGPWAVGIETDLELAAEARRNAADSSNHPTMFRVPSYLKTLKPEAYEHQALSFGLYDRDFEIRTRMDDVRLHVVSEFLEQMRAIPTSFIRSWEDMCSCVAGPLEEADQLRHLYDDGPGESVITSPTVRSVLTFDAVFLTAFLLQFSEGLPGILLPNFRRLISPFRQTGVNCYFNEIYSDLWLFENQIPLLLVRRVWNQVYLDSSDERFDTYMGCSIVPAVRNYLHPPAEFDDDDYRKSFVDCEHLLHCLYVAFCHQNASASGLTSASGTTSSGLVGRIMRFFRKKKQNLTDDSRDERYRSLPPVTELYKAGIVVRGEQRSVSEIRLVKSTFFKATLYLPQLLIEDQTEKVLRNLASFELFHRSFEGHKLIPYLRVMDDLINTEEDVRLLRKGKNPVIRQNYLGDDKDIAALFNALGQNVLTMDSQVSLKLKKDVNDWCMQKKRQMFIRFLDRFLDRPWILVSLSAAMLLLVMTALQTAYTIVGFYQQS